MAGSQRRIAKELAEITKDTPEGVTANLVDESDVYRWSILMEGPEDSPYAGGQFKLLLTLPVDYPFKPPALKFETKIYHPNVTNDDKGAMCLGILKSEEWKPSSKISAVLRTARSLLAEPNPDDAVETSIAEQFKNDRKEFERVAKEWVTRYASKRA
ncbi:ubiquitin-conjugating enzyme [Xylona heveae TC161]|uniref:E2 ubiquitin-conjugating enzyme n=1 Tax=Xylona heveae (strain CBS 132557 / TC161) TaxID=1328760 RepID=A0A164ZYC4_XYLHT|nr:ubiquitin-conjugating enzyme [Xylona heveae TC161]KZF19695.1 ubiquitin-conjugating enzyme [Xylona heveae TC161]